jgi:hypothetical protein
MDHSKCFPRSMTMPIKLIFQVHMVLVQTSMLPIYLHSLDLKSRGWLLFKAGRMMSSQPYVTRLPWLHQTHHSLHQAHLWSCINNQVHNRLHNNKHYIHKTKWMMDLLHAAVQRNINKQCMFSSFSYVVKLMRVIYCLSLVLYSYLGVHKRPLCWVKGRMHKLTWKTPRLLTKLRRVRHTRLRVAL